MRVEAQRAAPPFLPRQEKTAGNTINMFVILLNFIGLCEMSL